MLWESKFQTFQKKYCNQLIPPNSTLQKYYLESKYKGMTATTLPMAASGYQKLKYVLHTMPLANSEIYKMQTILTVIITILYNFQKLTIFPTELTNDIHFLIYKQSFAFALCVWMLAAINSHDICFILCVCVCVWMLAAIISHDI